MNSTRHLRPKSSIDWKKLCNGDSLPLVRNRVKSRTVLEETYQIERLIARKDDPYELENVQLEAGCCGLLEQLENEITKKNETADDDNSVCRYIKVLEQNPKLKEYIDSLDNHLSQASIKSFGAIPSRNKARKLRAIESQAEKALWFAETYGLVPEEIRCKTTLGENVTLNLNHTPVKDYNLLSVEDKTKLKQLTYILDRFCISEEAYHELSMCFNDMPRKFLIGQCKDDLGSLFHIERTPGNVNGAYLSFLSELERAIKYEISGTTEKPTKFRVKFSGDGAKISRISNFVIFSFCFIDQSCKLSTLDQKTVGIIKCPENYENFKQACPPFINELNKLNSDKKISVDGVTYDIELFLGGDMKFIQLMLGLGSALGNYACPWCKVPTSDRYDTTKDCLYYHNSKMFRSIKEIVQMSVKCEYGVKYSPLVNIEPHHIVPDELHLLMRICDILLPNLIDDARDLDVKSHVTGEKTNKSHVSDLVDKIRSCGVDFHIWKPTSGKSDIEWTSITGSGYKLLLEHLPDKMLFIINNETHESVSKLWTDFRDLYKLINNVDTDISPELLFEKCKAWLDSFTDLGKKRKGYQQHNVTPYMHVLVYHVPFFLSTYGTLRQFSGQGIEKTNDAVKQIYHSQTNKHDSCVDALRVRKRIEVAVSENHVRQKRSYKKQADYWENGIFLKRGQKQELIQKEIKIKNEEEHEINLHTPSVDDKHKETLSYNDCSVTELKQMLKDLGITTSVRKREKLINVLVDAVNRNSEG